MSKEILRTELNNLERKVKLLLNEHAQLKEDIEKIQEENIKLKGQLNEKQEAVANFQNQRKISKIVGSMVADESDTTELRKVIDDYIKEIDKCIAHLGEA